MAGNENTQQDVMCDAFHYLLDNIFIRFGPTLYIPFVGFPMGTNCTPHVADLFLFCYKRDIKLILLKLKISR